MRSTWSLQKGWRLAWSPWAAACVRVAGAVLGASRKGCGAPGRRGPRLLSVWQAQYWEPLERVAARLVAVGRGSFLRGRRLQKGLRRAWSPWAAAPVRVAGAVLRTSRKGCGAPSRRGPRLLSVWQAQYLEPSERVAARLVAVAAAPVCVAGAVLGASRKGCGAPCRRGPRLLTWSLQKKVGRRSSCASERVAARLVAVGRGSSLCGRRNTWSLQKGWRVAWSPWAAAPVRVAGAVLGASRKGCGAFGRRGPRLLSVWQAQYSEPLEKGCGAPGRRGPRLLSVCQAQYLESPDRVAARLGRGCCLCGRRSTWSLQKGLRRAWSPWAAAPVCVAGAILGGSRKGCGAPSRRGPRLLSVWQAQYLEPREKVSAPGRRAAALVCVAGAVLEASRKHCGAPGRRGPRVPCVWQAQYLEPPERVVAVGCGCCLYGRRSIRSL